MRRLFFFAIFALCLPTVGASQGIVWPIDCVKPTNDELKETQEYAVCLEDRIEQLKDSQNLLLSSILDLHDKFDEALVALKLELDGPERVVELIPATQLAVTHGYWAGGAKKRVFDCVPRANPKAGFKIFGAGLSNEIRLNISNFGQYSPGNLRGCAPPPFCDSAGEFCQIQTRAAGCYVNTLWFEWKKRRVSRDKSPLNYNTVCQ